MRTSKRWALFNIINGIYSGIPLCCTVFFTRKARHIEEAIARAVYEERGDNWDDGINYIRCDKCHEKNRVVTIKGNGFICGWLRN